MRKTIASYGDKNGTRAAVEVRGGHYYLVTYEPYAGERTSHHVSSRAEALATLTRSLAFDDYDGTFWYESIVYPKALAEQLRLHRRRWRTHSQLKVKEWTTWPSK